MEAHKDEVLDGEIVEEKQTTDLVPVRQTASALDIPTEQFKAALDRRKANRDALLAWIKDALKEGTDYGKIHVVKKETCDKGKWCKNPAHFSKDCLFKPGAEKICGMLGVTPVFPNLREYEKSAVNGVPIENVVLRCELQNSQGQILGEGVGARSVKKDYGDINKALKMAEKSAQIDATLKMGGLSEMFTQDLDDMPPKEEGPKESQKPTPQQKADQETKAQKWTESIWSLLQNSGHPDPGGVWKRAGLRAKIKRTDQADISQQKKFKEEVLSEIDDWRASLDSASDEAIDHDTAPLDDIAPTPEEEYGKKKIDGDRVQHLIDTAKNACDFIKDSTGVLQWARGQLKNFSLQSLEDLTIDEYEGLINILDHGMTGNLFKGKGKS